AKSGRPQTFCEEATTTMKTFAQCLVSEPRRWSFLFAVILLFPHARALAHDEDKKKPPTKAKADLMMARKLMDLAKQKLIAAGRYSCCVKAPPGSRTGGCDTCAKMNGSCNCGANLAQGKGVCGDCLAGWKTGRGAFPGVDKNSVTLLDSSHQALPGM